MKNCQPFVRELGGRVHVFAHNGDLDIGALRAKLPLGGFRPVGDTDSEYAFCALLGATLD
jgi:predicted glutamine amidotransferase